MRRIKFYVNNWIFGKTGLEDVIKRVAKIGYDGIELVGEPQEYAGKGVKQLLADHGLEAISICGMHPGPDGTLRALGHYEEKERRLAIDYVKSCVDLALEVGGRSVLVVPSLVGDPSYFKSKSEDYQWAVESLQVAAEYAEANKIYLTIEPINRYEVGMVYSINDSITMAKEIGNPYVRSMGDTFHMQLEEGDGIANALRRAGKYWLQHVHAADNTREAPGLGTMDWKEIIRALLDIEYEGGISLEPLPRGAQPYDARDGNIAADVLDKALTFGLLHLRNIQEVALHAQGLEGYIEKVG